MLAQVKLMDIFGRITVSYNVTVNGKRIAPDLWNALVRIERHACRYNK